MESKTGMKQVLNTLRMITRSTIRLAANDAKRQSYTNAVYGVADYLSFPAGMLLAAPFLLKHLGAAQYGVWILASAAVSSGGIVSGSFGDAVIKYVGDCRARRDWSGVIRIVRNMVSMNLVLSGLLAIVLWYLAPYMTRHIIKEDLGLQSICLKSLRIGSGLLLIKSLESVFISTLRAFETYKITVRIAICYRAAILVSAILLTLYGKNVVWIMSATLFLSALGLLAQAAALRRMIGSFSLLPSWHKKTVFDIAGFGAFSWLQAIAGIAFSHADRFFIGFLMGAPAIAYYGLCVQAAQPIHGLVSSGMHFLFPHLSARYSVAPISEIKRKIGMAIKFNIILVCSMSIPAIIFGKHILTIWLGQSFDHQPKLMFPIICCSFSLLGMNVTAHYAMLAIGKIRVVTYLNLLAGIVMLLLMAILIPKQGLQGAALARLAYGPITWIAYLQLHKIIWRATPLVPKTQSSIYKIATTMGKQF